MAHYESALLGRTEVAEGTMAFQFERPRNFVFKAGQYVDLTLSCSQPCLLNEVTHAFSSSAFEKHLLVTTRLLQKRVDN